MEKDLYKNLKGVLYDQRSRFLQAFLMVLFSNTLLIANPLVFRQALLVFDPQSRDKGGFLSFLPKALGPFRESLFAWGFLLVTIALVSAYYKYKMRVVFVSVSRDVERDLRSQLFKRIQDQSMAFYDRHGTGELLSRLTNDISAYRDMLGPGIMYPLFFITIVVPGYLALFSISKTLTLVALIPLFAITFFNAAARRSIYDYALLFQKSLADLSNMAQEHFSAIRIVKSYTLEKPFFNKFTVLCAKIIKVSVKLATLQGLMYPLFTLITKVITVALVMVSGIIILNAWNTLSAADFVSFMWIQSYIFFPILMLGWLLPIYERGRAAYDRLYEIYHEPVEVQDRDASDIEIKKGGDVEFCDLTFSYPESETSALQNITLKIKGGSFVGITGPVGSGKTTLFRLLNREYEIPKGMILIDGKEIHEYKIAALRKELVTVEQVPFIFSKTIEENVRFAREEATQAELEMVARYADLHENILEFPKQYQTFVGERGVTLSGGQKQRLAMARAFLVDRSILLLDDIFSSVDAETEKRIFDSISKNFPSKTVLLITHRASILEKMDRVIYFSGGRVLEDGKPEELKKNEGAYAALVELQKLNLRLNHV